MLLIIVWSMGTGVYWELGVLRHAFYIYIECVMLAEYPGRGMQIQA